MQSSNSRIMHLYWIKILVLRQLALSFILTVKKLPSMQPDLMKIIIPYTEIEG